MAIVLPDYLKCNNPGDPIIKLEENQVKGMGVFADIAARTALAANLRLEGYIAVIKDVDKTYMYTNADVGTDAAPGAWAVSANWRLQGDQNHTHTQGAANNTWTIDHNLNKYPNVTVVDDNDEPIEGFVLTYVTAMQLTLKFYVGGVLSAVEGKAYIN
jgi:hypothetical protein